ncbi:glycosyltransferase family protein [Halalkalibaculum sp. DA3122]|uniref:glycosyltransferase family protein n=1 Tax=unclassified Halalkalibaculum TaxID=2964617 RepID=UPI0037547380
MKILYGIQGTGHGHLSRARELLPELGRHAEVDVLISGHNCQLNLERPVRYRKYGISMNYDNTGGVSILETLRALRPVRFLADIHSIPVLEYDLVISDYEPVTAWAARKENVPSVALSHQAAFLSEETPRPQKRSPAAEAILKHFAPADHAIGFHFRPYDRFVEPPIIRSDILELSPEHQNHITVYLPAYDPDLLISIFQKFDHHQWHVFSPDCEQFYRRRNVLVHPVGNNEFLESVESCGGVISSSGFEMCAEAMFMGKKLLTIPIRNQYEQQCNAAAMEELGVTVLESLFGEEDHLEEWLECGRIITLNEVANIEQVVMGILSLGNAENRSPSFVKEEQLVRE